MKHLQHEQGTAIIMITHDLGVIANVCDRVSVMYAGRFVEEASVDDLFSPSPGIRIRSGLLRSVPRLDEAGKCRDLSRSRGSRPI